jgi:site-specific DNA-cytosine methylase
MRVRVVDLFCGCGGLSLGFELAGGPTTYDTVLGIDNDAVALRCYNDNFPSRSGRVPTGRQCDISWFHHPSEILFYYLTHLALARGEAALEKELGKVGLGPFLSGLRTIDADYDTARRKLVDSPRFRAALARVDSKVLSLAVCRGFLARIGLASLRTAELAAQPWQQEYELIAPADASLEVPVVRALRQGAEELWDSGLERLGQGAKRRGRGQHRVVPKRAGTLVAFLESEPGRELRQLWVRWRARRDSLRAACSLEAEARLRELYDDGRRVQLVLGGPPCKGFSRIGRAVLERLREQGASAWTSDHYGDERNALLHKYVLFLEALRPDAFIFENVSHFSSVLRTPNGQLDAAAVLAEAIAALSGSELSYEVGSRVIKARQHAVPQDRQRYLMVGFRAGPGSKDAAREFFDLPPMDDVPLSVALSGLAPPGEFAFGDGGARPDHEVDAYTLIDERLPAAELRYLRFVRQPAPGTTQCPPRTDAHIVRRARPDDQALMRKFGPGQRWMDYKLRSSPTLAELRALLAALEKRQRTAALVDLPPPGEVQALLRRVDGGLLLRLMMEEAELDEAHHLLSSGYLARGFEQHGDWFERLSANRPCKTIVAHIGKDTYGYFHPWEDRPISMREAARVQSFPDFFRFRTAGIVDGYSMIGNAVPPLLSAQLAERLALMHAKHGVPGRGPRARRRRTPRRQSARARD